MAGKIRILLIEKKNLITVLQNILHSSSKKCNRKIAGLHCTMYPKLDVA